MKTISIITPCYNEELNVREVYERVRDAIASLGNYRYEHIFIDNASTDNTLGVLKVIAAMDRNVKVIRNTRNFGHIRSPMHAFHQATGDVVIGIVADLQDPPEMIVDMVRHWEAGTPVVIGVKFASDESSLMFWIRKRYYRLVNRLSGIETYENFTGFGLYDRKVVDIIKSLDDPYPYFRGIIAELGFPRVELPYHQPVRKHGITPTTSTPCTILRCLELRISPRFRYEWRSSSDLAARCSRYLLRLPTLLISCFSGEVLSWGLRQS